MHLHVKRGKKTNFGGYRLKDYLIPFKSNFCCSCLTVFIQKGSVLTLNLTQKVKYVILRTLFHHPRNVEFWKIICKPFYRYKYWKNRWWLLIKPLSLNERIQAHANDLALIRGESNLYICRPDHWICGNHYYDEPPFDLG